MNGPCSHGIWASVVMRTHVVCIPIRVSQAEELSACMSLVLNPVCPFSRNVGEVPFPSSPHLTHV